MTIILAIETYSVHCSIGLSKNKGIYSMHSQEENSHGKLIFGFIKDLLKKSQLEKEDIDLIALSVGPGSFTGLRVGCSVAQGLAFGLKKKILPLSSLNILAQNVFLDGEAEHLYIVKEAHMNDLYVGKFARKHNDLAYPLIDDRTIKKTELEKFFSSDRKAVICCDCQEHLKNLSSNVLISRDHHVEGLLHLANYLEDIDSKLKNADEVYPTYLSGDDQWKKVR